MKPRQVQVILPAISLAVMMHLLLFAALSPKSNVRLSGVPVAPKTSYLVRSFTEAATVDQNVRVIRSPVVFSLPSEMGFSRALGTHDVRTRLTFSQEVDAEQFLAEADSLSSDQGALADSELIFNAGEAAAPALPEGIYTIPENAAASRRVYLAPVLKDRLAGGIILPVELNQETKTSWEVRASVSISEGGTVSHVLLDEPLESAQLNQTVLQMLYGLRFKPGASMEGTVEIYSPEQAAVEKGQ